MSGDDPTGPTGLIDLIQHNPGWAVALIAILWNLVRRLVIDRAYVRLDELCKKVDSMDRRLADLEGRNKERDYHG